MAKVLFLTQVLPYPLDAGPKVRAYHMLRHLAANHDLTLVSFIRPDDLPAAVDHLRSFCQAVHPIPIRRSLAFDLRAVVKGLATGRPFVIERDDQPAMRQTLAQLARSQSFDLIHADQTAMAGWGQWAAGRGVGWGRRPATVLDQHNAVHMLVRRMAAMEPSLWRRQIMQREAAAFARFEAYHCSCYDAVLTVSDEDRRHLLKLFPSDHPAGGPTSDLLGAGLAARFTVIPIAVDPTLSTPVVHRSRQAPMILHLGALLWPPNSAGVVWFARQVLPWIHQRLPQTRFVVAGKQPPAAVRALAADPRIQVLGYVADPSPLLAEADVFIVPVHAASGTRVKILDAWQWGLPLVSTRMGAESLATSDGENILLADTPQDFAQATLRLLDDPGLNERLRRQGRTWVEDNYDVRKIYPALDALYQRLLGKLSP